VANLRFGNGGITVEMDDALDRIARAALERVHPGLVDTIGRETEQIHRLAVSRWPVGRDRPDRRGVHSKDRWRWDLIVSPDFDVVRGRISNDAEWAYMVKPRFLWGKTGYSELVRRPMVAARDRLVDTLGPQVVSVLQAAA
jgi:hypothetical protein